MKPLYFAALTLGATAVFFACSSDDSTGTPSSSSSTDAGSSTSTGTNDSGTSRADDAGTNDGGTDSGSTPTVVNGCTSFTDLTASSTTTITFPTGLSPAQYSPPCIKVKTGTVVTFSGNFENHPLEPAGGDTPNPITETVSGATMDFTFSDVGTFGFHCGRHPSSMLGAVEVVAQ